MSIKLLSAAWDLDIGSTEKMVLMCLCDHASDGGTCWPSIATIARKTSKGERTIQAALKWLREEGYFSADERPGTSSIYHLNPRRICTPAEFAPPQVLQEPPQNLHPTPAKSAPKPPMNHQELSPSIVDSDDERASPEEVVEAWNETANRFGLPAIRRLTDTRQKSLAKRIQENTLDEWRAAIGAIERSPFLRGEGPRGWRPNFDWILKPANFAKLIEGTYDRG